MNEDDIELKKEICSFLDDDMLVDPPACFYKLYEAAGEDDLFAIKKEWNILIHFKDNTPEFLEELIENFIILVGDGAELCYNKLNDSVDNLFLAPISLRYQNAIGTALVAERQLIAGNTISAAALLPPPTTTTVLPL